MSNAAAQELLDEMIRSHGSFGSARRGAELGSALIAQAKASRTNMPEKYVQTGWSKNSPMCAKVSISGRRTAKVKFRVVP